MENKTKSIRSNFAHKRKEQVLLDINWQILLYTNIGKHSGITLDSKLCRIANVNKQKRCKGFKYQYITCFQYMTKYWNQIVPMEYSFRVLLKH